MRSFQFWFKTLSLVIIVAGAIWYMLFIGLMYFFNVGPGTSIDLFYWFCLLLHISIILICFSYTIDKIRSWHKIHEKHSDLLLPKQEFSIERKYGGMTVNERLYVSGLLHAFDDAVERKDIKRVISILREVQLSDENIGPILESNALQRRKEN